MQEIKNCQNCKKDFRIDEEDFNFYEKIKVPAPTFCPYCRMIRRMSFGNLSNFYKRKCDSCGENVVCLYSPENLIKMYCNSCWWKDDWDGTEYGMGYDIEKPFFEQLIELRKNSIFVALETTTPTLFNTKYTNLSSYEKDCYMTIWGDFDEHCAYTTRTFKGKDLLDCYRTIESELCYECNGLYKCYNCSWGEELDFCTDCHFCQNCLGCNNCVGCVNLKNKNYYIFNKPYEKEKFFKKLEELSLDTYNGQQEMKEKAEKFWLKFPKRFYHGDSQSKNVSGENIYQSKNIKDGFQVSCAEDCAYSQYLTTNKSEDCYDYTGWGGGASLLYECYIVGHHATGDRFCAECPKCRDVEYSFGCEQCKDCFGCFNLKRKQYCILNKEYKKAEYFELKEKIIASMKSDPWKSKVGHSYTYGEFLPPELSPFGYNQTLASEYKILTEKEAVEFGFNWFNTKEQEYKTTLYEESIPEKLKDTPKTIKKEVIGCSTCHKSYNISDIEFELLEKFNQPIPHSCPKCRHLRRFDRTNKPGLYDRNCDKCGIELKSPYSPDRPEIIFCDKCYQNEIL